MSKRNIEKHILMNKAEAQDLQKKAKRACLSDGGLIRLLLKGYGEIRVNLWGNPECLHNLSEQTIYGQECPKRYTR